MKRAATTTPNAEFLLSLLALLLPLLLDKSVLALRARISSYSRDFFRLCRVPFPCSVRAINARD
jgi:hypothetical protein